MAKLRVLLDLNIILDVLTRREPFYADSAKIWEKVETGHVDGMLAAHSVTTLFYLLLKNKTHQDASNIIQSLLQVFEIAGVDEGVIMQALALAWQDFEDAVQAVAAARSGAMYIITRNIQDYKDSPIPTFTPTDFLSHLRCCVE